MYATPTKADIDRNLSVISHEARHQAIEKKGQLTSELAARGLALSGSLIKTVISSFDSIHRQALDRAASVLRDFTERMEMPPPEIAQIARPHLQNMGNSILGELPSAGSPKAQQQVRSQYQAVFEQRLEDMLRDFEIGFANGRNVASVALEPNRPNQPERAKLLEPTDAEIRGRLLFHLYELRHKNSGLVPVNNMIFGGLSFISDEIIAGISRQLADAGLIEWTPLLSGPAVGTARIRASGVDAVERGEFNGLKIEFPPKTSDSAKSAATTAAQPVSDSAIEATREIVNKLKTELPSLALPNSTQAEVAADLAQIEIEIERPAPRGRFTKLFLESLRDNLAKATAAGVVALLGLVGGLLAKYFGAY